MRSITDKLVLLDRELKVAPLALTFDAFVDPGRSVRKLNSEVPPTPAST
jgi:hypothetical protein